MLQPIGNKKVMSLSMQRSGAHGITIAEFEGMPVHVLHGIVIFEKLDGRR
jgi:hypothetical protein